MALLLNIDTATETASLCISLNGRPVAYKENGHQREHASFVHAAVAAVLEESGNTLNDLDAISVTSGPGSYTGLRVGMATAKGFCYALSKPLITVNTLEVMTKAALDSLSPVEEDVLFCPMIDARRMEVFTALYNARLENLLAPAALLLEEHIFNNYTINKKTIFFGSGSIKYKLFALREDYLFADIKHNAAHLANLADKAFEQKNFADITYSEPGYFKEFYSAAK